MKNKILKGLGLIISMEPVLAMIRCVRPDKPKGLIYGIILLFTLSFILITPDSARAAAPTYQAFSAIAASTGADVTVTLPSHVANDIFLMEVIVRDVNVTITWPSGWTQIATVDGGTP